MKKLLFFLAVLLLLLTGCDTNNSLLNSKITTTVYPIEYIVYRLYGYDSKIQSIYPNGSDPDKYNLTKKQLKDFASNTNIFVYNGLTKEKEVAKSLLNLNKRIQIIDVTYGIKSTNNIDELWLNPNNYLTLVTTVKNDLIEINNSKYSTLKIEENFEILKEEISLLDVDLRTIASAAKKNNSNTIIIGDDAFAFLQEYGFQVINIANEANITTSIKNEFKEKRYTTIFVRSKEDVPNHIKDLVDNYSVSLVEIDTMETLSDEKRSDNDDYMSIMRDFFKKLSDTLLKKN